MLQTISNFQNAKEIHACCIYEERGVLKYIATEKYIDREQEIDRNREMYLYIERKRGS